MLVFPDTLLICKHKCPSRAELLVRLQVPAITDEFQVPAKPWFDEVQVQAMPGLTSILIVQNVYV